MSEETSQPSDRLTPASGVSFGDRARVRDIVGQSEQEVAVALSFDDSDEGTVWLAAELVDFVDHGGASEIVIGDRRLTRAPDGSWVEDDGRTS
jgi:hypothetical protein